MTAAPPNQPMPPLSWNIGYQLTPTGERIVVMQLVMPTATGGMVQIQTPPLPSASAKQLAKDIESAATGLVVVGNPG